MLGGNTTQPGSLPTQLPGRDTRTRLLEGIGGRGVAALNAARVLVVGAGGLGSPALAYLQAAGVGTLAISDSDTLEASNLNRQVIHPQERLGQPKAESAGRTVRALNPATRVEILPALTPASAAATAERYDLVVDATDTFAAKYMLADACAAARVPHVWASVVGYTYQVSTFVPPHTLRELFPAPPSSATPSGATHGVLGAAAGQAGAIMAGEAIKLITRVGRPLVGRVLVADVAAASWDVLVYNQKEQTEC